MTTGRGCGVGGRDGGGVGDVGTWRWRRGRAAEGRGMPQNSVLLPACVRFADPVRPPHPSQRSPQHPCPCHSNPARMHAAVGARAADLSVLAAGIGRQRQGRCGPHWQGCARCWHWEHTRAGTEHLAQAKSTRHGSLLPCRGAHHLLAAGCLGCGVGAYEEARGPGHVLQGGFT